MHAKYLTLLALSSMALGQDWLEDAMDALESTTDLPVPTGVSGDVPTLDEWIESQDSSDIPVATGISGSSSSSSDSDSDSGTDSSSTKGIFEMPSSIVSEIMSAVPSSALSDLTNPTSLSSIYSEIQDGNYPAWATDLPDDVWDYFESAYGVEARPTGGSGSSSGGDEESQSSGGDDSGSGGDGDGAGMLSPSVFASVVGAVSVLGLALAL
ncbi:uncharacterized protein BDW70DRAFT_141977 [Aspergillus foveolatus]|uniref:uncharacterized protein n=1 Tax=Aspergillus foveolatus TaxID=210207 RepID=UPI003CCDEBC4